MNEPAPLVSTASAATPAGGGAEWFRGAHGARLRAALFSPTGPPVGSVLVNPGRTEPIEKYYEVVERLLGRGLTVLVHDWRGHGLSARLLPDRLAGHAHGFEDFLTDHDILIRSFGPRLPPPRLALGHSMGGCLTLLALARGETRFAGAILSAPMLALNTAPVPRPLARVLAAAITALGLGAARVPTGGEKESFETNLVTHDAVRYARNLAQIEVCPDLPLGPPTWGWLDFAFTAITTLQQKGRLEGIATPTLIVAAGEDRVVDNAGARSMAARMPGASYVEVAGAFHELMQETPPLQDIFWREFDGLARRVGLKIA